MSDTDTGRGRGASTPEAGEQAARAARERVVLALAVALAALLAFLVFADDPWDVPGGPDFFAADRHRPFPSNVVIGLWWAAAANALGLVVLLSTARRWTRALDAAPATAPPILPRRRRAAWLALVAAAVVLAGALRVPLAQRSLWWDETWVIREAVVGTWHATDDGGRRWRAGGLQRSLWTARKPTNHALYSVAAWASLSAWRAASGAGPTEFDELAYRLPSLAAALLAVVALALLAGALGFPWAGPLAALILALHPWHVRYGVDGRAYGLVMLFAVTSALGLVRFLRTGRWRDLGLHALAQGLVVWSWPYAAFLALGLAAGGVVALWRAAGPGRDARTLAGRLLAANALAAMAFLQVFAPNLTLSALWDYTGRVAPQLPNLFAGLTTGMLWEVAQEAESAGIPGLRERMRSYPAAALGVLVVWPVLLAGGLLALLRRRAATWAPLVGWLAAGPVSLLVTHWTGRHFYPRFQLFLLPLVVLLAAIACERAGALLARGDGRRASLARIALPALALVAFQLLVAPQTRLLLERPYAPLRDVVTHLRAAGDDALVGGLGFGTGAVRVYAADVAYLDDEADVVALCREAQRQGRPFLVFYGYPVHNRSRSDALGLLEDPRWFALEADLWGIEPEFRFRVFRARGGCAGADGDEPFV